ncbi:MAG: UbiA family prenyltransferase [Chitinophagales bacterium]|nr:UbiA family prenyltransferase [Chitinophagales bacterium]
MKLYRPDAALVTFFSFLFATYLAGVQPAFTFITIGLAVSLISVNFIYSVNSVFDSEIDAVNKPDRPLAANKLSRQNAMAYVAVLLIFAIVYPFFIKVDAITIALIWVLPVLGILYSNPWFPFKKKMYLAAPVTALVLVLPMFIGLKVLQSTTSVHYCTALFFLVFCLFTVPLKDIEDEKGDVLFNSQNWAAALGAKRLTAISALLNATLAIVALLLLNGLNAYLIFGMGFLAAMLCAVFIVLKFPLQLLYRSIIAGAIICGSLFYGILLIIKQLS